MSRYKPQRLGWSAIIAVASAVSACDEAPLCEDHLESFEGEALPECLAVRVESPPFRAETCPLPRLIGQNDCADVLRFDPSVSAAGVATVFHPGQGFSIALAPTHAEPVHLPGRSAHAWRVPGQLGDLSFDIAFVLSFARLE